MYVSYGIKTKKYVGMLWYKQYMLSLGIIFIAEWPLCIVCYISDIVMKG